MSSFFDVLSIMKTTSHKESSKHVAFEYDAASSEDSSDSSFFQQRGHKNRDNYDD